MKLSLSNVKVVSAKKGRLLKALLIAAVEAGDKLEDELKRTKRALYLLRADYADLQVYANVKGIGMENGKECDFYAKSRDYWTKKADKFKEEN